jgi:hypothetical protein
MAVYVDDARRPLGRMLMCHMWADSKTELLHMADRIGVSRKWMQQPPRAKWLHFDICSSKREAAIRCGAIPVDELAAVEHRARKDIASGVPSRVRKGERALAEIRAARVRRPGSADGQADLFGGVVP